jgi:hypothetical protein
MAEEQSEPEVYYAFNTRGNRIIAGPFKTRLEATPFSKKVGMACRYCGECSGGMTICRACICECFEDQLKKGRRKKLIRETGKAMISNLVKMN